MNPFIRLFTPVAMLALSQAPAQYQVFFKQDFEATEWPEKLIHGHNSSPITTQLIRLEPPIAEALYTGVAAQTVGKQVMRFQPLADDPHLSVINQSILAREKLGATGAALYQVDIYLDSESPSSPRVALLAQAGDPTGVDTTKGYRFYRFGLDEKGRVFFSFTNEGATPAIFQWESITKFDFVRPGWARFQMIFKGQNEIHCLVNGRPTSYSPITDDTLKYLAAGIMVTRTPGTEDPTIFADNLSIHWSANKEEPIPASPWGGGEAGAGGGAVVWDSPHLTWLTSPSEAWKASQESRRVMLVLFHDNRHDVNLPLSALLRSPEAEPVLSRCTLLRLNVETAGGRKVADSYGVTSAPVLMVCDLAGKAIAQSQLQINADTTWEDVYSKLRVKTAAASTTTGAPAAGAGE